MSNKAICRTCSNTDLCMVSLFIHKINNESIKDMLSYCTSIKISEDDLLPQHICNTCLELLEISYKFRRKCHNNDLKFRSELIEQQKNKSTFTSQVFIGSSDGIETVSLKNETNSIAYKTKHNENQTEKKSILQCDLCGKTFTKKYSLIYHLRIHTGQRNYICSDCNKTFPTSSQLSAHQRCHNGYKPHVCNICNKSFAKSSNLNVHLLLHQNKKRFSCTVCEKKFSQKSHLISHHKLHSGYKPFSCHCGATFTTETNLKRHANIHLGIKNFLCNYCGNLFNSCNDLNRHILTHSEDREQFICNMCLKHFTRLTSLHRHKKKIHGK